MIVDEARIDPAAVDGLEVQRLQQALLGGAQGEVRLHVDHVPLHIATLHHGLQLAVVGGAVLHHLDAGLLGEGAGPGFLLSVLGSAAPAGEVEAFRLGLDAQGGEQAGDGNGYDFALQQHLDALSVIGSTRQGCLVRSKSSAARGQNREALDLFYRARLSRALA